MTAAPKRLTTATLFVATALGGCQSTAQAEKNAQQPEAAKPIAVTPTPMPEPAQGMRPMMGGWHHRSPYGQLYLAGKAVVVEGEILKTTTTVPMPQMAQGIQVILKTRDGEKTIHLGPSWFIDPQEFTLTPGDKLKVEGRAVTLGQETIIMAQRIQKGSQSLVLRDESGFPFWAGGRMMMEQHKSKARPPFPALTLNLKPLESRCFKNLL